MQNKNIEQITLGSSGISVSKVCLGTWAIGGWMWGGSEEDNRSAPSMRHSTVE
jgi:aryl-alcohol dehydrogenase-like predicted oxidoreductase